MTTPTMPMSAEQRVVLHDVSWETYERLLAEFTDQSAPRLSFNQGTLEIMSPRPEHEKYNRRLALLIEVLAEELAINVEDFGSTTFRRRDLARGFEPHSCFYIQHEAQVSGKTSLDLTVDPPPDLVIEIDITSSSLDKLPIYAALGVPEVWRYDGQALTFYRLKGEQYMLSDSSLAFPGLTSRSVTEIFEATKNLRRRASMNCLRTWAQTYQAE